MGFHGPPDWHLQCPPAGGLTRQEESVRISGHFLAVPQDHWRRRIFAHSADPLATDWGAINPPPIDCQTKPPTRWRMPVFLLHFMQIFTKLKKIYKIYKKIYKISKKFTKFQKNLQNFKKITKFQKILQNFKKIMKIQKKFQNFQNFPDYKKSPKITKKIQKFKNLKKITKFKKNHQIARKLLYFKKLNKFKKKTKDNRVDFQKIGNESGVFQVDRNWEKNWRLKRVTPCRAVNLIGLAAAGFG